MPRLKPGKYFNRGGEEVTIAGYAKTGNESLNGYSYSLEGDWYDPDGKYVWYKPDRGHYVLDFYARRDLLPLQKDMAADVLPLTPNKEQESNE